MFWKKSDKAGATIDWVELKESQQLDDIVSESHENDILIYKHSTRCGISGMTLNRLERSWKPELAHIRTYYLDLISYRDISNEIANRFGVYHESPQIILIREGRAIYDESHSGISVNALIQTQAY
jgi:bacillithiol system protein YtxJ